MCPGPSNSCPFFSPLLKSLMTLEEFIARATPGMKVKIGERVYTIAQIVKWRMLRSGRHYHKYTLVDENGDANYRLAEDPASGQFLLVHIFESNIDEITPTVMVEDKEFAFGYSELCVADEVSGQGQYEKGSMEVWWDYESRDGTYLSLGNNIKSGEREDLIGKRIDPAEVEIIA